MYACIQIVMYITHATLHVSRLEKVERKHVCVSVYMNAYMYFKT